MNKGLATIIAKNRGPSYNNGLWHDNVEGTWEAQEWHGARSELAWEWQREGREVIGHVRWSYYATFYEFLAPLGANKVMDFWKVLGPLRKTEDGEKYDYQNGLV
ncbi:hypothetical protein R6Q57_027697 [Mikania cordata]